jgi:hypothetical protein
VIDHCRRVRGVPVRLVLVVNSKPQFDLVGQPDIKSVADLKGKIVGISSRGGAVDILTQTILAQHGVTANKDATLIVIGSPEELVTALRTGRIGACLLTPRQLILYRDGFTKLAYSGDYLSSYPTGGVGTTVEKIKNNPAEVMGFVRASLKGQQYFSPASQRIHRDYFQISRHQGSFLGDGSLRSPAQPSRRNELSRRRLDARRHRLHQEEHGLEQRSRAQPSVRF